MKSIAESNNTVVLFSTHSIELIRSISPENIFYNSIIVEKHGGIDKDASAVHILEDETRIEEESKDKEKNQTEEKK